MAKGQLQVAFAAQRLCAFSRLMLAKAAWHVGGDAGIKAIIRGSNEIQKPAHGQKVTMVRCVHHSIMERKMDTLAAIGRWLSKQHVVTWCVSREDELWCANAFYVYDPDTVAFYLLSEEHTRHGQMTGQRAKVAGTVNGQPKTVALIRGVQFKGEIRRLSGDEEARMRQRYVKRFPVARMLSAPVWEIRPDEIKFTDNTLGFGKKLHWRRDAGAEQA